MSNIDFKRPSWEETYINIAKAISMRSTCCRHKVGAIITSENRIISTGYNGVPSGHPLSNGIVHCCQVFKNMSEEEIKEKHHDFAVKNEIHAEQNAIAYAAKSGISVIDSTMYVTLSPCYQCAKLIVASGIKKVYYEELYSRDDGAINYLRSCGIETLQVFNS